MSNCCCKYAKWFPHNWLCLKGLYYVFVSVFYLVLIALIAQIVIIANYPFASSAEMWQALISTLVQNLFVAVGALAVAKILNALRKIKQAVAPCCCETKKEETKETK